MTAKEIKALKLFRRAGGLARAKKLGKKGLSDHAKAMVAAREAKRRLKD